MPLPDEIPRLAILLAHVSYSLFYMNRLEEALLAIREAVVTWRRAVQVEHTGINKNSLARSLTDLCICLTHMGRYEEAVAPIRESVSLYEGHTSHRLHRYDFSRALMLLSHCLGNMDNREEAHVVMSRVVDLDRQEAIKYSLDCSEDLASTLR